MKEEALQGPTGIVVRPDAPCGTGVLVLAGSSGRVDTGRARLLARHGALTCSIRWFGDDDQPPGVCRVPLETFTAALDRLAADCDRLAVVGVSYGAEATLLTAVHDPRVTAVVGFAPTHVVWQNAGPGRDGLSSPPRSKWTWGGRDLPFVPYDQAWEPDTDPPAFRGLYDRSLDTFADRVPAATIPVELIAGALVLVAGGADAVWSSVPSAHAIAGRRGARRTTVVTHPEAGHRTVLPGETPPPPRPDLAHGGHARADAELGADAWPVIVRALALDRAGA